MMEHQEDIVKETKWRIAHVKLQVGSIGIEVEEPHNAQVDLDCAIEYYLPGLLSEINLRSGELTNQESKGQDDGLNEQHISLPPLQLASYPEPSIYIDGLKCLNMLGILWAGRSHHLRALYYFYTAKEFYHLAVSSIPSSSLLSFESLFTHNLFYLAQAYGNVGNAELSCQYCLETLKRQIIQGFANVQQKLEWVKNCSGIADYSLATNNYLHSWYALLSAESVLQSIAQDGLDSAEVEQYTEIEASLQKRFIKLDVSALKIAYEVKLAEVEGIITDPPLPVEGNNAEQTASTEFYPGIKIQIPALHLPSQVFYYLK